MCPCQSVVMLSIIALLIQIAIDEVNLVKRDYFCISHFAWQCSHEELVVIGRLQYWLTHLSDCILVNVECMMTCVTEVGIKGWDKIPTFGTEDFMYHEIPLTLYTATTSGTYITQVEPLTQCLSIHALWFQWLLIYVLGISCRDKLFWS